MSTRSHIETTVGETFSLRVDAVPTAGYTWEVEGMAGVVQELQRRFVAPAPPARIGGARVEEIAFKALKAGEARLKLRCKRAWETTAVQEREVLVTVHQA